MIKKRKKQPKDDRTVGELTELAYEINDSKKKDKEIGKMTEMAYYAPSTKKKK